MFAADLGGDVPPCPNDCPLGAEIRVTGLFRLDPLIGAKLGSTMVFLFSLCPVQMTPLRKYLFVLGIIVMLTKKIIPT